MKVIDYVLVLVVVFLVGYSVYQKRSSAKDQNLYLKNLTTQLQGLQDQLDELSSKDQPADHSAPIIKEVKDTSSNLNSQLELLSEDISSKLEKTEEKINYLMEQEKKKKDNGCCNTKVQPKVEKQIVYKEKIIPCNQTAKFYQCIGDRQAKNLKACQEAKLLQGEAVTKTAELHKTKQFSKLETINENITVTRITNPKNKLVVDEACFESREDTVSSCMNLLCR
jgi:hypothetical protein